MWITKWNLNMLWGMAYPEMVERFIDTGLICYKKGNHLPRAVVVGKTDNIMTGCTWTELIVGAYMKGIRGFDSELALNAMLSGHNPGGTMGVGYNDVPDYLELGYCPLKNPPKPFGSAGRTMEYAASDWALAQYGKALGREDIYDAFMKRSGNWRNLFDKETGFIRPKLKDGSWREPFDPLMDANKKGFVEANSWQSTWLAVYDVEGLAQLLGGRDKYCEKLNFAFENSRDANFAGAYGEGYVSFGNQPGLPMAHLFNYAGKPWLSQYWVRQVNEHCYGGITPDEGYGGHDEDQGIMGATSALMSMGLSQVRGGCSQEPIYEITAPVFDEVTIHLDPKYYPGKTFRVITRNNSAENIYIQSAKLNGKRLDNCWFYHRDFVKGGTLELVLGPKPNKAWGVKELPPSVTTVTPEYAHGLTHLPTVNISRPFTARGENAPDQTAKEAFDGDINTKWLDFSPKGSWIQRAFDKSKIISSYAITSAEDAPPRDPKDWQLLGSNDGMSWTTLDARTGELWSGRHQKRSFSTNNKKAYRIYRLNITAVRNLKSANSVQIAEIEFKQK
jgi:predicted alpha-1,2-mannosidase